MRIGIVIVVALVATQANAADQAAFCNIVDQARAKYANATGETNQLKRERLQAEARAWRKAELVRLVPGRAVSKWIGTVGQISSGSKSLGVEPSVEVDLGCQALLHVVLSGNALRLAEELAEGQAVAVSGKFVPSEDGKDAFFEWSITEAGGMREPEFGFAPEKIEGKD